MIQVTWSTLQNELERHKPRGVEIGPGATVVIQAKNKPEHKASMYGKEGTDSRGFKEVR